MAAVAGANARESREFDYPMAIHVAELHWYEAGGIGRKEYKIKQLL